MALRILLACVLLGAGGCSTSRFVPSGEYLLDRVRIDVKDTTRVLSQQKLMPYVHQRPNNRFLHLSRLRLGIYNMSGRDSTKWWNKWMRRMGEAPVIYNAESTRADSLQLLKAARNAGFLGAEVRVDTVHDEKRRGLGLQYHVDAGAPHRITSVRYEFPDTVMRNEVMRDSGRFIVHPGMTLDRTALETQRDWIAGRLRNRGYWAFSKEFITYNADTAAGSHNVALTMRLNPPYEKDGKHARLAVDTHSAYILRNVTVIEGWEGGADAAPSAFEAADSVNIGGIGILYGAKGARVRPSVIEDNIFLRPGEKFSQRNVERTYDALARLQILKFVRIQFTPAGKIGGTGLLDAWVLLTPGKSQTFTAELEGTNSEGDFGVAVLLTYSHRNIMRGSETLNLRARGSYQALEGKLDGFLHRHFMEYGAEAALVFPEFKLPFVNESFRRRINARTELRLSLNYQERPEFTRVISAAGWNYIWTEHNSRYRHTFTPIDINYIYLPKSTQGFLDLIAPQNPLLRNSYEDHFIMRAGYNFYYTNKRRPSPFSRWRGQKDLVTVRVGAETAGNFLFGLSELFKPGRKFHSNPYKVFGIRYSQYVRAEGDCSYLRIFDRRNSLAVFGALGIGVPYGNSRILPFEKRFYGGGANGVRGWSVRTLGPGRFPGANSVSDFIFQCGDIKMLFSAEYRVKLFWVVEGGIFVDAGNVWTVRNYPDQPWGKFRFNSFYKEFASSYGIGIRLDFNYFLVRLDLGMKAHNPAMGEEPWPLLHPRWGRDRAFHFAVGYPF